MEKRFISIVLYSARSVEKKTLLRLLMIGYKKKLIKPNRKDLMFAVLQSAHIFFFFIIRCLFFNSRNRLYQKRETTGRLIYMVMHD